MAYMKHYEQELEEGWVEETVEETAYEALDILFKWATSKDRLDLMDARRLKKIIGQRLDIIQRIEDTSHL